MDAMKAIGKVLMSARLACGGAIAAIAISHIAGLPVDDHDAGGIGFLAAFVWLEWENIA